MLVKLIERVKHPSAAWPVEFDFANDLEAGETITLAQVDVTVSTAYGTDATPSALKSGSPTLSGAQVYQELAAGAGIAGADYYLTCVAPTNLGHTYVLIGRLRVRDE